VANREHRVRLHRRRRPALASFRRGRDDHWHDLVNRDADPAPQLHLFKSRR
jgi:hypothetical protein